MTEIKFNDFSAEYHSIKEEIDIAISNVLESGWLINGEQVRAFEKDFSTYIGAKFGIGVNSGSDALYLSVKAIDPKPGDEIITVSHTMISTVDAIARNGAKAVMVDIDDNTFNIDPDKIEESINEHTKAIIPVHLYGHPSNMERIKKIADDHDLYVIEDVSQAIGSECGNKKAGSFSDIAAYSLYPTKNLGGYGDAGIVTTDNSELKHKVEILRNYGQEERYNHVIQGINSRLDEIQASILRVKLRHLDEWNDKRRQLAKIYDSSIVAPNILKPVEIEGYKHVYHLYVIRTKNRKEIIESLKKAGIPTLIHYPVPVHKQKSYLDMGYKLTLPVTEAVQREIISLPIHPFLESDKVRTISDRINSLYGY